MQRNKLFSHTWNNSYFNICNSVITPNELANNAVESLTVEEEINYNLVDARKNSWSKAQLGKYYWNLRLEGMVNLRLKRLLSSTIKNE